MLLGYHCAGGRLLTNIEDGAGWTDALHHEWQAWLHLYAQTAIARYGRDFVDYSLSPDQLAQLSLDIRAREMRALPVSPRVGDAGNAGILGAGTPPSADPSTAGQTVHYLLGDAYPQIVAGTTVLGGLAGYVFGGPLAVLLGFVGGNVAGRLGAMQAQKIAVQA